MSTEHFPPESETFQLKDGTMVEIRPIRPDDAPRLQASLNRLSEETIYLRFMKHLKSLTDEQARELATVDYQANMALVAVLQEAGEDKLIGVARYTSLKDGPEGVAEVGVVVEDRYQNLGLGGRLLDRLTLYAKGHGIHAFTATVFSYNNRILDFIRRSGLPTERELDTGSWEIWIDIHPDDDIELKDLRSNTS